MEKFILVWDKLWNSSQPIQAFAVFNDCCLVSFSLGTVEVVGKYSIELNLEPVYLIFHIKSNFFGICQNSFSVVQIEENCYTVVKVLKDRVLGCYEDLIWTKFCVLDENFKTIYSIPENEGEIVQVCKTAQLVVVSSLTRTVIVGKEKVIQVGKKERNGAYGACVYVNCIYASRPLGNLWQANYEGVVMITTNYKVNLEKVNFGSLFKMEKFLLSISQKNANFIIIDPGQQFIVHYEKLEQGSLIFFNLNTKTLYKYYQGCVFKAAILTISEYFQRLLLGDTNETVNFVLNNPELQDLKTLQPLCVQVFCDNCDVVPELFDKFCSVVKNLEENLSLPDVKVREEVVENDELFDEFLRLSLLEKVNKVKISSKTLDKRIKQYQKKNFTWPILLNWLLYSIYQKNENLFKTRTFLKIASKSLDYEKFSLLLQQEKTILVQIESTL